MFFVFPLQLSKNQTQAICLNLKKKIVNLNLSFQFPLFEI